MASRASKKVSYVLIGLLSLFVLFSFFPLLIMVLTSFKSKMDVSLGVFHLPNAIQWDNYSRAFETVVPFAWNSILIAVCAVAGVLVASSLAAYAFARYKFPGREILYYLVIALMMVPTVLVLIPMFKLVAALGMLNSYAVVILPQIAGGCIIAVFLLRSFFAGLPEDLFESFRIDGAKELRILRSLVLPLSKPILGTIAVLNFHSSWNDYIWPLVTINDKALKPIVTGIMSFSNDYATDYGPMMAAYVLASVPLILVISFAMKYFVDGLTSGAVKA
ncbi:carbohydrate ABC transporter permease [Cohnella thailandensis]|uniref:Carbohydrate ABC transporter permease n=1 Tax=Cohnella thailandensis TaxID=557557 RepID=A0A841SPV0_9BACL|nr:carbohydrate ABC transporter permease [Cohnella thailandensis]MBB6632859.1 carbohydrate ABC transporter permease [Cohnella thailandensis]MBP1975447.1 ABC-type glycerol-3-phosphate transport system permease component [Cohnella thailandensis]